MSTIFVSHHNNGYRKSTKITDLSTMNTVIYTDDNEDYEQVKEEINELNNNKDATFSEYEKLVNKVEEKKSEMSQLRYDLGIIVNSDNSVTLPNGVNLPEGIASIFDEVDDEQHFSYLMKFATQLMDNPYDYAKKALIDWVMRNPSLKILPDGSIQGYRAVRYNFTSNHRGYGIVNDVEYTNDHLDNTPGNILKFPRFLSDHNPNRLCGIGLHVGTRGYAQEYYSSCGVGAHIVSVAFSPKDVVSPPEDGTQCKIRVCEMEILEDLTDIFFVKSQF